MIFGKKAIFAATALAVAVVSLEARTVKENVNNATDAVKSAYKASSPRAVGLRLGYGMSLSYQQQFSEKNMVSIELDMPTFRQLGGTITYDWIFPMHFNCRGQWNWFIGAGISGGGNIDMPSTTKSPADGTIVKHHASAGYIGIAARGGVEYNFWFPLQLAVEWRPVIGSYFINWSDTQTVGSTTSKQTGSSVGFYVPGLYASALNICVRYRF